MRVFVAICLTVLVKGLLQAEEPRIDARTILIRLSTSNALATLCGRENQSTHACARFVGRELRADCSLTGGRWRLRPEARFTVLIYALEGDFIQHELVHARDMEKGVAEHVKELERLEFGSEHECRAAAASAAASFRSRTRQIAGVSSAHRD